MQSRVPMVQIKVTLYRVRPEIWRRLLVPANARLDWLHAVLQVAMGWNNSHLHRFNVNGRLYSNTQYHFAEYEDDPVILEEADFKLGDVVYGEGAIFSYEYDFGDDWQHQVVVERLLPPDSGAPRAALSTEGQRACPPEDCGGCWGYEELLSALRNQRHPEHARMRQWLGREFDAEAFDIAHTNLWLRKLPWPHVSVPQLGRVLTGRDKAP
jgi:hypothetical protein